MESKLSQIDIEALLKAAGRLGAIPPKQYGTVEPCHFERSGQFSAEQASVVNDVQEALAKGLTQSLGAYLRVSFETVLISVTQTTYRESVDQISPGAYLLSIRFHGAPAAVQLDKSLVFPLIDVLLGGTGVGQTIERDVTEIEDHVMGGVSKILCHALAAAWATDLKDCDLVGAQGLVQMQRLLPPNDRVVTSQFEIKLAETTGNVRIVVPVNTANGLLRKLSSDSSQARSPKPKSSGSRLGETVLECSFPATLGITTIRLPIDKVLSLDPGQVCDLGIPLSEPASLIIAGRDTFEAIPVRRGKKRAAQVGLQRTPNEKRIIQ
jgi:flagellar motor switch protein FliM